MIPSQKLTLSEELCRVESVDELGKKKRFVCQVCEKSFLRKDKANYHIYHDHHEEFVRHGKGLPKILQQNDSSPSKTSPAKSSPVKKSPKKKVDEIGEPSVDQNEVRQSKTTKPAETEKAPEPEPDVVKEDSEEEKLSNEDLTLFPPPKRYRKTSRKIKQIISDVQYLIELQEEHRRLRHRKRLTDSNDALEVMKKYRAKKAKATFVIESLNNEQLKFRLKKDETNVSVNPEHPLKLKIFRKKPEKPVDPVVVEESNPPRPEQADEEQKPLKESSKPIRRKQSESENVEMASKTPAKKSRVPAELKPIVEPTTSKQDDETKLPIEEITEAKTADALTVDQEIVQPILSEKRRGRPPKKEVSVESEIAVKETTEAIGDDDRPPSPTPRRGRPSKQASMVENQNDEEPAKETEVESPTKVVDRKRSRISKKETPIETVEEIQAISEVQQPEKKRGRHLKKEISLEAEAPAKEPEVSNEVVEEQPRSQTPEKRRGRPPKKESSFEQKSNLEETQPESEQEKITVDPHPSTSVQALEQIEQRLIVQDSSHLEQSPPAILDQPISKKPARGRGRTKKVVLTEEENPADNESAEFEEEEEVIPKRTLRKRAAPSESEDQSKIAKMEEQERDQAAVDPVEKPAPEPELPEEQPAVVKKPKEMIYDEKKSKEPLKLIIANDKKEGKDKSGLKFVIRSPDVQSSSSEISNNCSTGDAKYVVQSSNENPLKIKLKTSDKNDGDDHHHHHKKHHHHHHKKGLKLKLLLNTADGKKVIKVGGTENKDKKKKKKLKLESDQSSENPKSLVLRIKSPNPSEIGSASEISGGNGLHKIRIQKSKFSESDNSAEMAQTGEEKSDQPKMRKLDEAIKKYVAKITEVPAKKKTIKGLVRKLSQSKLSISKMKSVEKVGNSSNDVNHQNFEESEKLPPIKTKIVLNRQPSCSSSTATATTTVEEKAPITLSSHEEVEKIEDLRETQNQDKATRASNEKVGDKEELITQELSVRVRSLQPRAGSPTADKTSSLDVAENSSPIVAFSPEKKPSLFSQDSRDDEEDDDIGLAKGTFNDLMKVIDDDEEENDEQVNNPDKSLSTVLPTTSTKPTSVEHLQVDGSADNWSRASQSPPHSLSSADEIDNDDYGVIRKRMKQMQQSADNRPKSKFALIKRVFSTYTKNRKIVIVKYKKPQWRLYDREEFDERIIAGTVDDPYDEDDDNNDWKTKLAAAVKRKGSATESEISLATIEHRQSVSERAKVEEESDEQATDFHCSDCERTFPNLIRFHAHMQMHKAGASKKRKSEKSKTPGKKRTKKLIEEERILQVDGETDLDDLIGSNDSIGTTQPVSTTTSTMTMAQITQSANGQLVVSAPSSAFGDLGGASIVFSSSSNHPPTHLLILKRHPGDNLHQDAGLIQFDSAGSLAPTLTSVASNYGGPFRCDRCSEGFRSRKALNNHCSNVHSVSKFTSVYPCTHCNSLFRLQSDLETHIR